MKDIKIHISVLPVLLAVPLGIFIELTYKTTSIYSTISTIYILFYLIYTFIMINIMSRDMRKM